MNRYQHLHGAYVASPPWDTPDLCHDCGRVFKGTDDQHEDEKGNTVCDDCIERHMDALNKDNRKGDD